MIKTAVSSLLVCTFMLPFAVQERSQWQMPEEYKEVQVRQLEAQRNLLLAMADSMPQRLYRDRATPSQRDFAGQLHHAANGLVIIARDILDKPVPIRADTATVFNEPGAMKAYLNQVYDFAVAELRAQSAEDRNAMVEGPGRTMPRWQLWDEIHHHTMWTAGQTVANFRKHGMAPHRMGFLLMSYGLRITSSEHPTHPKSSSGRHRLIARPSVRLSSDCTTSGESNASNR